MQNRAQKTVLVLEVSGLGWQTAKPAEATKLNRNNMNGFDKANPTLLEELKTLETELHRYETRSNRQRMETLLHPDFVEFGRSGTRYTRADILKELGPNSVPAAVHSCHFDLAVLAQGVALLTYVSAHLDESGNPHRHTLRSSLWVYTEVGWQVRFHQGTPTTHAAFDQQ
jgi:hypothetical protein